MRIDSSFRLRVDHWPEIIYKGFGSLPAIEITNFKSFHAYWSHERLNLNESKIHNYSAADSRFNYKTFQVVLSQMANC